MTSLEFKIERPINESKEETQEESNIEFEFDKILLEQKVEDNIEANNKDLIDELEEEKVTKYELLEKLLSFLENEKELNCVLVGYFSRVVTAILETRKWDFIKYLFTYKNHIANLMKHDYNNSISTILYKVISNEGLSSGEIMEKEFTNDKIELLKNILKRMADHNNGETILNSANILCSLIDNNQQLDYLLSKPVIAKIFEIGNSANPACMKAAISFFITIIKAKLGKTEEPTSPRIFRFTFFGGIIL